MSGGGDRAVDSSSCTDSDNSVLSPAPGERRSGDFSISAILSDETGGFSSRRKGGSGGGRSSSLSGVVSPSCLAANRTPLHMQHTGKTSVPLSTPSRFNSRLYTSPHPPSSRLTPSTSTPSLHWGGPLNQSLSPFNLGLLLPPLSPSPTSTRGRDRLDLEVTSGREGEGGGGREEGFSCNDSLGMLSAVAVYHSELMGGEGKEGAREHLKESEGNAALSVGDGMARMRLESSSDTVETTMSAEERRSTPPHPPSPPHHTFTTTRGKGRTPCILKRDRKRPRQLADSFPPNQCSGNHTATMATPITNQPPSSHSQNEPAPLDAGYISPTSAQKSPHHSNLSFSPSIFLSQPANSGTCPSRRRFSSGSSTEAHMETDRRERIRQDSESDNHETEAVGSSGQRREGGSGSDVGAHPPAGQVSRFVTSTPIKHDKENAQSSSGFQISPTYLSPGESGGEVKKLRLRDLSAYETSSGSDSDAPQTTATKSRSRSQAVRRRSKARAQLSPLLENACSPIAKTDQPQRPPSSLLTANFPATSAVTALPPPPSLPGSSVRGSTAPALHFQHQPSLTHTQPPPVSFPYLQTQVPAMPFPFSAASAQYLPPPPNLYMGMMPTVAVTTCNPLFPVPVSPLSPPNAAPFFVAPPPPPAAVASTAAFFRPPSSFYYGSTPRQMYNGGYPAMATSAVPGNVGQKWGSSPLSMQIEKTGQIQSVPPWFIFEQNRPEGKRSRLTEAINRSLSETPSHNPKLPAGWTKYACGQTDDQIQLTQKARLFLQSGRRQLTFNNIST